jgi:hypothetical protein
MRSRGAQIRLGGVLALGVGLTLTGVGTTQAIDVKLTLEEARKALEAGRAPMEKANTQEEVKKLLQQASVTTRVGADPEKDPCGASAILRTKRFTLEGFGRKEATESKKQKKEIRMPDEFIQKVIDMPHMEIEVQLCGDDEYFADKAQVALQQGSKMVKPDHVAEADRGRKNEGPGAPYRSRFTARFSYDSFDPNAKTKFLITLADGKLIEFDADFSKIK